MGDPADFSTAGTLKPAPKLTATDLQMLQCLRTISRRSPGVLSKNVTNIVTRALDGGDINPAQLHLCFEAWHRTSLKRPSKTPTTEAQSHGGQK